MPAIINNMESSSQSMYKGGPYSYNGVTYNEMYGAIDPEPVMLVSSNVSSGDEVLRSRMSISDMVLVDQMRELEKTYPQYSFFWNSSFDKSEFINFVTSKPLDKDLEEWILVFITNHQIEHLQQKYPQHNKLWDNQEFTDEFASQFALDPVAGSSDDMFEKLVSVTTVRDSIRVCIVCPSCQVSMTTISVSKLTSQPGLNEDPIMCPLCKLVKKSTVASVVGTVVSYVTGTVGSVASGLKNILYKN